MLFHFQLRPLSDVEPWGYPDNLRLHWFGLTDGWYWLQMDESNEFFRYSADFMAHRYPEEPSRLPYADYYVVRLWEDVVHNLLPAILDPLPPRFARLLETDEQLSRWQERIEQWEIAIGIRDAEEGEDEDELEETEEEKAASKRNWETYLQATMWWHDRKLDVHPLTASPSIWFWKDGQDIHAFWDNSQQKIDNILTWDTQRGHIQLPAAQFLDEVGSFHTRLFAEMEERIQEAKKMPYRNVPREAPKSSSGPTYNPLPSPNIEYSISDIALDFEQLEKEQQDRFQWLAQSLERAASRVATDWNAVIDAMRTMDEIAGIHINS